MPEWPKGHASKACDVQASVGSNPTSSAKDIVVPRTVFHIWHLRRARTRSVLGRKAFVSRSETYLRREKYREGERGEGETMSS